MAKKKKSTKQKTFSEKQHILKNMRKLPISECYETGSREDGEVSIIVTRHHVNGNTSVAFFLVDLFCCGVKDTMYKFNIDEFELAEVLNHFDAVGGVRQIDYVTAHNLIYGAVAYAEDNGIPPHRGFSVTEYFLEPDDENIPLIEMEFGRKGKPCLICDSHLEFDKYRKMMLNKLQPEEFECILSDFDDPDDLYDEGYDYDEEYDETSFDEENTDEGAALQ